MEQNMQTAVVLLLLFTISILSSKPHGRELRPSEHGLPYQQSSNIPTAKADDPQLHSFFAGAGGKSPPSSALPEARNLTWWNNTGNNGDEMSRDSNRKDHVREVLLVSSLVCGAAGVVLLAVSGFVFVVRLRKKRQRETSLSTLGSTSVANVVNK
ncbi:PREDICTED: uncharacterized protein LOC109217423 [Nicotiana attenuata]|uniref:Transmembrane protein n=1 Tax=Nicotiana attenuata TaxID=49451 RepID=A0A1J6KTZ2_NICAT|nr:PREDICTED: uncharacterized protein LOC109217423 [Nicotiana attenuata]OIT22569.1 hypothetical protein A4A49_31734 [Nicotiana attenuata]